MATKLLLHFWLNYFVEYLIRSEMANMGNFHSFVFRDDVGPKYVRFPFVLTK